LEAKVEQQNLVHRQIEKDYRKRIRDVELERDRALTMLKTANKEKDKLQKKMDSMLPVSRKTLDQLSNRTQFNDHLGALEKQLGPGYKIVEVDTKPSLSGIDYLAFQRIYKLPYRTVNALSKIPKSTWPTVKQLRKIEDHLIKSCGEFVEATIDGTKMIWAKHPNIVFGYIWQICEKLCGTTRFRPNRS
jgi:hypothetical protein